MIIEVKSKNGSFEIVRVLMVKELKICSNIKPKTIQSIEENLKFWDD